MQKGSGDDQLVGELPFYFKLFSLNCFSEGSNQEAQGRNGVFKIWVLSKEGTGRLFQARGDLGSLSI